MTIHQIPVTKGNGYRYYLDPSETFLEVINAWINDPQFRLFYSRIITDQSFDAVFWEHPPITRNTLDLPYEFVLIESTFFSCVTANPHVFSSNNEPSKYAITFPNLGGDARLVTPVFHDTRQEYAHLVSFLKSAPANAIHEFWSLVGQTILECIGEEKTWLSTSGLGVYWLHVRLDSVPKYYQHEDYKHR